MLIVSARTLPVNQREDICKAAHRFIPNQLTDIPPLVPQVTDTANPYTPIPVYYFHSLEQPFCRNETCKCHWQQRQVRQLLGHIVEGDMSLREAADFIDDVNGERK